MSLTALRMSAGGPRQLRKSAAVTADLKRRADRIAAAAGPGMSADVAQGRNRARATVWTDTVEARVAEARDRTLTRSIDAGRG